MKIKPKDLKLYCITDRALSPNQNVLKDIEEMARAGCKIIQLREKNLSFARYISLAQKALIITQKYGAKLIINDSVEVACASNADGVHLGQTDGNVLVARMELGPEKIIGLSISSWQEYLDAPKHRLDYLAVGSIFPTSTKKDFKLAGLNFLKKICQAEKKLPIIAIGGINQKNINQVWEAGVSGVAMISEILLGGEIKEKVKYYLAI